ncbi:EVE domain-containing protein [Oceanicella actignis]|uniref:Predicted RNA-binding protein, contains PUA-like domain n=1 Tax=Oceanicella actignis TaxID=1189325 RepID=A0A1M7TFQ4_9RHOB|nr:EVE domain-containing protein [Oceanicella actignis]TYO88542.1 putative RNA-binding protein with PUA-like domain [Oceanicella actignis]SET61018.1 Predicted RNA-binding protein, contains PUA-like domain [Oceanicella actignis]SHN69493.1 Predicted RNA-binding protein, contains PUA-like domain [Oceanicella actignis]
MARWLFKSEPNTWSWEDQVARGDAGEPWDGVRNYQARNNMRAMKKGDKGFFYHSVNEKRIMGVVEVIEEARQDPTTDDPRWECVTIRALAPLPRPVTLEECKNDPRLKDMVLVRNSRLSVQPVSEEEWRVICELGGLTGPAAD